ncbi:hypothetical protein VTJ49DRAFT_3035 [Mycothermus thermophilus]|uniref:Extracellular membrane protein CFEM domain-containing protein n=1 Tax=Humicola insolens TaxID=85995 RepID=A0ABR3V8F6_HUMIN
MVDLRRVRLLPAALVAAVLIPASHAVKDDWSHYPADSQACLAQAGESSRCESRTVEAQNACYCRNGGNFVTTTAECVGRTAPELLKAVYDMMEISCRDSNTPLTISEAEFMEAAEADEPAITSPPTRTRTTETSEPTDEPTSTTASGPATVTVTQPTTPLPTTGTDDEEDDGGSGLSTGAMAGVIAGAIGGFAVLAAIVYILMQQRKKTGEESHPMLPQTHPYAGPSHTSMAASAQDTSYYGASPDVASWHQKKEWASSPDARTSLRTWDSPYLGGAAVTPPQPPAAVVIQELDGSQHFPPGSAQAPAEMSGSPVDVKPAQPQQHYQQPYPGSSWQQR